MRLLGGCGPGLQRRVLRGGLVSTLATRSSAISDDDKVRRSRAARSSMRALSESPNLDALRGRSHLGFQPTRR